MALYRVRVNLSFKGGIIPAGQIVADSKFTAKSLAALLRRGAVSEVAPPPLAILPGWDIRAKQIARLGIMTVSDLIEADAEMVASDLDLAYDTIHEWQEEVKGWLQAESMITRHKVG